MTVNAASTVTATFTASIGSIDHFVVTAPSTATAGAPFTLTITAKDASGNTITTYSNAVGLSASSGTISPTSTGTTGWTNGVWSSSAVTLTKSGSITITANDGSGHTGTAIVTVSAGTATKLVFTVAPTTVAHDQFSSVFTVQLQDQYGNAVNAGTKVTVNLSDNTGGRGVFSTDNFGFPTVTSVTIASGSNSANFYWSYQSSQHLGSYTITAAATGLTSATTSINVT
jgi:hypothetical protein